VTDEQRFKNAIKPSDDWGPSDVSCKGEWQAMVVASQSQATLSLTHNAQEPQPQQVPSPSPGQPQHPAQHGHVPHQHVGHVSFNVGEITNPVFNADDVEVGDAKEVAGKIK
jgi:hypothetical protein